MREAINPCIIPNKKMSFEFKNTGKRTGRVCVKFLCKIGDKYFQSDKGTLGFSTSLKPNESVNVIFDIKDVDTHYQFIRSAKNIAVDIK